MYVTQFYNVDMYCDLVSVMIVKRGDITFLRPVLKLRVSQVVFMNHSPKNDDLFFHGERQIGSRGVY